MSSIHPDPTAPPRCNEPTSLSPSTSRSPEETPRDFVTLDDLFVVFQPIIDIAARRVFAHEALTRCRVPALQDPEVLFNRSVERGCTGRLGRMVRQIAIPLATGRRLFVNVHPQELTESWLVRPDDPLFLHDHELYVEITESVPLAHFDLCLTVIRELRSRGGIRLVVDDLGAGYSNLKSIADLEPTIVKLDRGLVLGIERSARQRQLVSSIVALCRDLDASVVAEGIEREAELTALIDCGVQYAQGYLFARPSYPFPAVTWPECLAMASVQERPPNSGQAATTKSVPSS